MTQEKNYIATTIHPRMKTLNTNNDLKELRHELGLSVNEMSWIVQISAQSIGNYEKTERLNRPLKLTMKQVFNLSDYLLNNNIQ